MRSSMIGAILLLGFVSQPALASVSSEARELSSDASRSLICGEFISATFQEYDLDTP
jgi:hypothetical protein